MLVAGQFAQLLQANKMAVVDGRKPHTGLASKDCKAVVFFLVFRRGLASKSESADHELFRTLPSSGC